jgi:hypothetical protein
MLQHFEQVLPLVLDKFASGDVRPPEQTTADDLHRFRMNDNLSHEKLSMEKRSVKQKTKPIAVSAREPLSPQGAVRREETTRRDYPHAAVIRHNALPPRRMTLAEKPGMDYTICVTAEQKARPQAAFSLFL